MKNHHRTVIPAALAMLVAWSVQAASGPGDLIPKPVQATCGQGSYILKGDGSDIKTVVADKKLAKEAVSLGLSEAAKEELYRLDVDKKGVRIRALTPTGAFRAKQTLDYMAAVSDTIQWCSILDYPRFQYRGVMLDISRHFRDKKYIMRQIDALSKVKVNYMHLHLTDDAGWRIQIDKYPRLASYAAWRKGRTWMQWNSSGRNYVEEGSPEASGGYLSKDDVREILAYAAQRHMTIVPEIEIPGHSLELAKAYPEIACLDPETGEPVFTSDICPGTEKTFEMYEDILSEVIDLFPSPYIHIGGDEAGKRAWRKCPRCQARMRSENLGSIDELQSYVIGRICNFVKSKGREMIGWDEIMEGGLAKGATVMSWRGTTQGAEAMSMGHNVIMSPTAYCYLDYYQDAPLFSPTAIGGFNPLYRVYGYNPTEDIPEADQARLLGVQGNLWAEFVPSEEHNEYMLYPRTLAIAEIGWTPQEARNYECFEKRVEWFTDYLIANGYHPFDIRKAVGDRPESKVLVDHMARGCKVNYLTKYSTKYKAGGDTALTDGKQGSWGYAQSDWQGFNNDMDVVIDLGAVKPVHYVGGWFLSNFGNWITFPEVLQILVSDDGVDFEQKAEVMCQIREEGKGETMYSQMGAPLVNCSARYVRVKGILGKKPQHGFIFVDEIVVN